MKPATILRIHPIISSALDLAVRYDWADRNVAKNASPPHPRKREPDPPRWSCRSAGAGIAAKTVRASRAASPADSPQVTPTARRERSRSVKPLAEPTLVGTQRLPHDTSLTTSELNTVADTFNRTQMWENVLGVL